MTNDELRAMWTAITDLWPTAKLTPTEAEIWRRSLASVEMRDVSDAVEAMFAGGETRPRLPDILARVRASRSVRDHHDKCQASAAELAEYLRRAEEDDAAIAAALRTVDPSEYPWLFEQACPKCPKILQPNWDGPHSLRHRMALESIVRWLGNEKNFAALEQHRLDLSIEPAERGDKNAT